MVWGDTQQRLAALFAGVGAKITDKKPNGQTEIWTVQGLIAPDLQASMFTFQGGLLVAMEFDYGQKDWDLSKYNDKMGLFRRVLEIKCGGPGEMVSRDTIQEPNSTVKETFMGYQWNRGDTSVQLFYFSAEDTVKAMSFRAISVHYHYKDPMQEQPMPEQAMPEAGGSQPADPNSNPLFGGGGGTAPAPAPGGSGTPVPSPTPAPPVAGGEPSPSASPAPATAPAAGSDGGASPSPTPSPSVSPSPSPSPKGKKSPPTSENDPLPER